VPDRRSRGHQTAEAVPEQVDAGAGVEPFGDRGRVGGQVGPGVVVRVRITGRLVLAALVVGDDRPAGVGQQRQDRGEVVLAPGPAGDEDGRPSDLDLDLAGRSGDQDGEVTARGARGRRFHAGREVEDSGLLHERNLRRVPAGVLRASADRPTVRQRVRSNAL